MHLKSEALAQISRFFKHPKEIKTSNPVYDNGRPYVYGKQNTLQVYVFGLEAIHSKQKSSGKMRQGSARPGK